MLEIQKLKESGVKLTPMMEQYSQIKTKDYYNLTMDSVITILLLLYLKTLFVFKH